MNPIPEHVSSTDHHVPHHQGVEQRLAAGPAAPSAGRRFVAAHLRKWGLDGLTDACELVVSELVTNAVTAVGDRDVAHRAAPPPGPLPPFLPVDIIVVLRLAGHRLFCEVWDCSERLPVPAFTDDEPASLDALADIDEHGRGLLLVAGLCTGWGYRPAPMGGKVVSAWWDLP